MDDFNNPMNTNNQNNQPEEPKQDGSTVEGETFTMRESTPREQPETEQSSSWDNSAPGQDVPTGEPAASQNAQEPSSFDQGQSYAAGQDSYGQAQPSYSGVGSGYGTPGNAYQTTPPNGSPFAAHPPKTGQGEWAFPDYDQPGNFQDNAKPSKQHKNKGLMIFSIVITIVFVLTAGSFAGYAILQSRGTDTGSTSSEQQNADAPDLTLENKPETNTTETTSDGKMTTTAIAKKVRPSVVGIVVYTQAQSIQEIGQASAEGSGIILDESGYIVTNAHVVEDAASIKVVLDNEEEYTAETIGVDSRTDLAVIKIDADNLSPATLGDSSQVEVGETVLAIGNPSGLSLAGSVTQGIVSATDRLVRDSSTGYDMNCIQTDAAINPGNSGGALVNEYGQVIGINSSKIAATDYEGIGFAIPTNEALPVINSLMQYGYVKDRPRIGITYQQIDEVSAQLSNVPAGLFVIDVDETTDAYAQGVRSQDIITQIDGQNVSDAETVASILENKKPGDTVELTIYRFSAAGRDGTTFNVTVTLEEDRGQFTSSTTQQQTNPFGN